MPPPLAARLPAPCRWIARGLFVVALLTSTSDPARADATVFFGLASSPSLRPAIGAAIGGGLIFGFEFEYAHLREDVEDFAPSLRTYMGNLIVQTPLAVSGVQFYGTIGGGIYTEAFEDGPSETFFGSNLGGGVKIGLAGPLRVRLDYRVFFLQGSPVYENPSRFYAGLNLSF